MAEQADRLIVDLVAGARPNFMKLAPVHRALKLRPELETRIIHTGQHYDHGMTGVFFEELRIPEPAVHLGVGSGSHGAQTARILESYEAHLLSAPPSAIVVFGDVNSTIACALAAVKLGIPVVHVEAGLRSFDRTMPEEINRILTDSIAELLLVSEHSGLDNLRNEGIADSRVRLVGNVMIDTLVEELARVDDAVLARHGLEPGEYGLVTMHRPSNVDDPRTLRGMVEVLVEIGRSLPLVFPIHPRTRRALDASGLAGLLHAGDGVRCLDPIPYRENLALMRGAKVVLTDSGGMQEETTHLGVPCLTLRENTERPVTTTIGTSRLVGSDPEAILTAFRDVAEGRWPAGERVPLWDGHAAERVAREIAEWLARR